MRTLLLLLISCGPQEFTPPPVPQEPTEADILRTEIAALEGTVAQINSLVLSDWATCDTGGPDSLSTLQQNMCEIAQAANVEARFELKGVLASFVSETSEKLADISTVVDSAASSSDIDAIYTDLYGSTTASCSAPLAGSVCAEIDSLQSQVTALENTVNDPTTGVAALNTAISNINSQLTQVINGAMVNIDIGNENLLAGPFYESVLRNPDRSRITAYIESFGTSADIGNDDLTASNGSGVVTVETVTAHGLSAGGTVEIRGVAAFRGLSRAAINTTHTVIATPTASTFTVDVGQNATSSGSGGKKNGYIREVIGRGLGNAWSTGDGQTTFITTFGDKPYRFIVTGLTTSFTALPGAGALPAGWGGLTPGEGFVCYDTSNRNASSATILNGGSDVICK